MSDEAVFDDTIRICEFYSDEDLQVWVDYENHCIRLGGYLVDPVTEDGELVTFMVSPPSGPPLFMMNLDEFLENLVLEGGSGDEC